jgi:hypothetical protein
VLEISPWPNNGPHGGIGAGGFGEGEPFGLSSVGYGWGSAASEWGYGAWGVNDPPRAVLDYLYNPTPGNVCTTLPVGVKIADEFGNASDLIETVVSIADPPQGVRDLDVHATASPLEARLTWTESPDV